MDTQSAPPTYLPLHWKTGRDVPPEQGVLAGMTWAPRVVPLLSTSTQSLCLREFESHYLRTPARGPASLGLRHRGRGPGSFTTAALPAPVPPWSEVGRKARQDSGKRTEGETAFPLVASTQIPHRSPAWGPRSSASPSSLPLLPGAFRPPSPEVGDGSAPASGLHRPLAVQTPGLRGGELSTVENNQGTRAVHSSGQRAKCFHQKFFLKSTLTFPLCALHQLAPSQTSFPVHPALLLLLKRDYQAEQEPSSKEENKSLCSFPALTFSVHRVHPRPPQKPTGHWSLHPKMSQGPSEGVEPGYRNFPSCQTRALLDTNFCPAFLALGAKIGFPAQRGQSSCGQTQLSAGDAFLPDLC